MRNRRKILIEALILFLLVSGCSGKSDTSSENQVVIRVNGRVLTLAEFNDYFEPIGINCDTEQAKDSVAVRESRLVFLLQLVEEMIILKRADELGLHISPQELDEAVRDFKKHSSEEDFKRLFLKQAISLEAWKKMLKRRLLVEKVIHKELLEEISITPQEIKDYYDKHWKEWSYGEEVRVRQILFSSEDQAKKILERIQNGDDFATLARLHSVAPEAKEDGDMGHVVRGQLPECLEKPIFKLELGSVSPVIKTPYGFHIFKVIEKRRTSKPEIEDYIEKIKENIRKERVEKAYGPWLAKLRSRYHIEINKEAI